MKQTSTLATLALLSATSASAITVTANNDANALVNNILGTGVTLVGTPTLTAVPNQTGIFTGGGAEVGFNSGIVLTTGDVNSIAGSNTNGIETTGVGVVSNNDTSTDLNTAGAPEIPGSFDAASLAFDFQFGDGSVGGSVNFAFTFASEEYVDFVGSVFNDEFQLLVDGVNLGTINGQKVNVNNVNAQSNSANYVNNVDNTDGIPNAGLGLTFDGVTTTLLASSGALGAGTHSARFVVADVADGLLDAGVFIQAGTFNQDVPSTVPTIPTTPTKPPVPTVPPVSVVPLPAPILLLMAAFAGLGFLGSRRRTA